ncbi:MAG TPA: BatD family protein [Kofleriaceae bacterium]|nr:BatD family protein [Kofleriaceae bacterium]
MRRLAAHVLAPFALLWILTATAHAQSARLQLDDEPHTGVPFTLGLVAQGFDETPAPAQPKLEIPGAVVTPMGAQPNVSQSIQIINGRRTDSKSVSWVFRYRVEINKAGRVTVPPLTVVQGSKKATAQGGQFDVESVPTTDDMKIELQLPNRTVFVGETIEAKLIWLFRVQPQQDPQFSVPLMSMDDFIVSAPPATDPRRALNFAAGSKELQLPYELDQVDSGGQQFHRVTVRFYVAPKKAGKNDIPPASVSAALPVGRADFFGNAPSKMFRALDTARSLDVKPLPETDKPPGFAGAVGSQFSIAVGASRSVVQLGEPVELTITLKSDQRLDTLSLGRLDGPGGLPKDKFTVPADAPTGELSDDGKTKTFKVTAQVIGPASEIPAIAFSYFDVEKGRYQTIHSDPIAVSVKGGSIVGANDVIAMNTTKPGTKPQSVTTPETDLALVGADLALSAPGATSDKPLGGSLLWLLVGALYLIPLAMLGVSIYRVRTHTEREEASEVRAARKRVEAELARAAKDPARDTAGALVSALRAFARAVERSPDDDGGLLAKIETESFAPSASSSPLSQDLRSRAEDLVRRWTAEAKRKRPAGGKAATVALVLGTLAALHASRVDAKAVTPQHVADETEENSSAPVLVADASDAKGASEKHVVLVADASDAKADAAHQVVLADAKASAAGDALGNGRSAYQQAMSMTDASARKAAFARAEVALGEAVHALPDSPELLADWGNAALGAGDVGTATLAYRRALALDAENVRARRNLEWLRSKESDMVRPHAESAAADALFFFHSWPRGSRLLVGAVAFAIGILLLVPWGARKRRWMQALAIAPGIVWLALTISVLVEDRRANDAVVMEGVMLRAADSPGAPTTLAQALPRGAEVTIVEARDGWTKIRLASGTAGWVPQSAVEKIR